MTDRPLANPVQTADLIEDARRLGFAPGLRLLTARMADLADQAAGLSCGDPGRLVALSNVLLLVAEVNRMVATESLACVAPR